MIPVPIHDPRLEPYRDLRLGRGRGSNSGSFIVEGALALGRLLDAGEAFELVSILATASHAARLEETRGDSLPTPIWTLPRRELATLVGFDFHRGVLACARRPTPRSSFPALLLDRLRHQERVTIVAAEGLADPRNLGALVRNAAAFGVDAVISDARGADLFARLTIRASVGNVFGVPSLVSESFVDSVDALARELGATILAATPAEGAPRLGELTRPAKLILLVGNEGAGLSASSLALAHQRVRIPVEPGSDSINVAAAGAVLLYELCARA